MQSQAAQTPAFFHYSHMRQGLRTPAPARPRVEGVVFLTVHLLCTWHSAGCWRKPWFFRSRPYPMNSQTALGIGATMGVSSDGPSELRGAS